MRITRIGWSLVALGTAAAVAACGGGGGGGKPPVAFSNPPEISSENGVLSTTLTVEPAEVTVANEEVTFLALYNGMYMPPILRVQPGDTVQLLLRNYGVLSTNLHYHGLNVTPMGAGDNIFLEIEPGISFENDFPIPASHPQGLYWYHPHFDPLLNTQIAGGMSGGIIIGNILAPFPELADIPERVMLLKDLKTENGQPVTDPDPGGPTKRTINGLYQPQITMQPGQLEFWRIGNIGSNIYYQITLGQQPFNVIAQDGNLQNQITDDRHAAAAARQAPRGAGLRAEERHLPAAGRRLQHRTGRRPVPRAAARHGGVEGAPVPGSRCRPASRRSRTCATGRITGSAYHRLRRYRESEPVHDQRQAVQPELHRHHRQPRRRRGVDDREHGAGIARVPHPPARLPGRSRSTVSRCPSPATRTSSTCPPRPTPIRPASSRSSFPSTDPVIVGKFVYHCHIIQHEDQGMMATIYVQGPGAPPPNEPLCQP